MQYPCLEWNPIPARLNHYSQVDVVHFSESILTTPNYFYLVTTPSENPQAPETKDVWCIVFHSVCGYRHLPLGYWPKGSQPPWPYDTTILPHVNPAMWEIQNSGFIEECVAPFRGQSRASSFHHFVIVELFSYYEIVARDWKSEKLPETWEDLKVACDVASEIRRIALSLQKRAVKAPDFEAGDETARRTMRPPLDTAEGSPVD